jgi:small subunit ribosomal protein S6e
MRDSRKGIRKRKLVRGNMITEEIYQINCLLLEGNLPITVEKSAPEDDTSGSKLPNE